jgi:MFS family permease
LATNSDIVRRNFLLNLAEGVVFVASTAFVSPQIVLPALIARLGGDNLVIGAIPVIIYVGLFLPQIFAARYVETLPWKKPWAVRAGIIQRAFVLLMAATIGILGGGRPSLALGIFLFLYGGMHVVAGIATPGWFDFFTKVTPPSRRGRLAGLRTSVGSVAAFFCGFLLTVLLSVFAFPANYAVGFIIAFALQMASVVIQIRIVEPEPSKTLQRRPIFAYLRDLPQVFKTNIPFRDFVFSSAFLIVANMPIGFFAVHALKRFHADESAVGVFTLSMISTQIVAAFVGGIIADRYGNKRSLIIAASGSLAASLWALLAPSVVWFRLVFMFLGFNLGTEIMARYNIAVEYGPVEKRSTYVALMNTALAPVYLSGLLGGWISDRWGYPVVFALGVVFSLIGLYHLLYRVRDPREISGRTTPA